MKARIAGYVIVLFLVHAVTSFSIYGNETGKIGEYFEKSFNYEAQGNYDASRNSVLLILRIDHKNYAATLRAGWLSYLKGSYKESRNHYKKAVSLVPDAIEPKLGLMLPLMASKKWNDAKTVALEILRSDEKNYLANSRLAYILFSQGRYGEAEKQYSKVIRWYPSDIEMKLGIAWTYLRMGRKKEAAQYFREVLTVRRNNPSALTGMEIIENRG